MSQPANKMKLFMSIQFYFLDGSILSSAFAILGSLCALVLAIAVVHYISAAASKVTKTRTVSKRGTTIMTPNTFDDINDYVAEKVINVVQKIKNPPTKDFITGANVFRPKHGIGSFTIGTKISDIIAIFGETYTIKNHNYYSTEYIFEANGMSFFVKYSDTSKKVFSISLFSNSVASSSKGISIGSTVEDMIAAHGSPKGYNGQAGSELNFASYNGFAFGYRCRQEGKLLELNKRIIEVIKIPN